MGDTGAQVAGYNTIFLEAMHKDLCCGKEVQALIAQAAEAQQSWQQKDVENQKQIAELISVKDDAVQKLHTAQQMLGQDNNSAAATAGQPDGSGQEVLPHNQHSQQLQEKNVLQPTNAFKMLTERFRTQKKLHASVVAEKSQLQTQNHQLSQSLHEERAISAKSMQDLHCLQNNYDMQRAALESKGRQLLEVNKPVLNYLDAIDSLEADCSTSMVKNMYAVHIQTPVTKVFNILKKDYPAVLQSMFHDTSAVVDAGEASTTVGRIILRKLFLHAVNIELDRAVWGSETALDAVFKPFASKQQVLCNIQDLVNQQHPEDLQDSVKTMVNRYLSLHREFCKLWRESSQAGPMVAPDNMQTALAVADDLCTSVCGTLSEEALDQVRPHMQVILGGAMQLRMAVEILHPLYRLYVPQEISQGVCQCPGIAVIPDGVFAARTHQIILQAELESLS